MLWSFPKIHMPRMRSRTELLLARPTDAFVYPVTPLLTSKATCLDHALVTVEILVAVIAMFDGPELIGLPADMFPLIHPRPNQPFFLGSSIDCDGSTSEMIRSPVGCSGYR